MREAQDRDYLIVCGAKNGDRSMAKSPKRRKKPASRSRHRKTSVSAAASDHNKRTLKAAGTVAGDKEIKGQKRKTSARPHAPASTASRRTPLVVGLILCSIIVGFYYVRVLTTAKEKSQEAESPVNSTEPPLHEPVPPTLTVEQEFAKLKEEEMDVANEVMRDFPDSGDSYVLMGDLYARHRNSAEAMKFWEKSVKINPRRYDVYRDMGTIAQQREEFDKAVVFGRKALEIKPDAPGVRSNIARALMDSGKYAEAITELEEEIKLSARSIQAHFQLAEAYLQQKQYDKAKEYYEKTIELEPSHSHAYHGLITIYVRLKQRDKAREYQAIFKKLKTNDLDTYMGRQWDTLTDLASLRESVVRTYLDAERLYRTKGDTEKVEELLIRACELEPTNILCLERLGSLYFVTNRAADALKHFEKIRQIDPNNLFCYLNIGQVSMRLRLFDKAETAFRKAITLAPKASIGYRELARLYLRANTNLPQAQKLAQKALALEKTADNYFIWGWACDVNGDRTGALEAMEQAVELEPENQKYRQVHERIKSKN
jgi:tetratricopeptide (TPR) repeat protein